MFQQKMELSMVTVTYMKEEEDEEASAKVLVLDMWCVQEKARELVWPKGKTQREGRKRLNKMINWEADLLGSTKKLKHIWILIGRKWKAFGEF